MTPIPQQIMTALQLLGMSRSRMRRAFGTTATDTAGERAVDRLGGTHHPLMPSCEPVQWVTDSSNRDVITCTTSST